MIEGFQSRTLHYFSTRRVAKQTRSINTILVAACAAFSALLSEAAAHTSNVELRASDRSSLGEMRIGELDRIAQQDLPLRMTVKLVQGKGAITNAVFADRNCGYCNQFEEQLKYIDNVTIYTVLCPVLGPNSLAAVSASSLPKSCPN